MKFILVPANPTEPIQMLDPDMEGDHLSWGKMKEHLGGDPTLERLMLPADQLQLWFDEDGYITHKNEPNSRLLLRVYPEVQLLGPVIITDFVTDGEGNPRALTDDSVADIVTTLQFTN